MLFTFYLHYYFTTYISTFILFYLLLVPPLDRERRQRGLKPLPTPTGVSPRRSLDGTVVEVARLLKDRCRAGMVSLADRNNLSVALLDSSDRIRSQRQGLDSFRGNHAARLDALDDELNGDFWRQRAMHSLPWDPR